jgi:hypothetical protein
MGTESLTCTFFKQDFKINIVVYLLNERTAEPEKQPLLANVRMQQ